MAIKDYWVYQKRDTPTPWALYIVKEYDKRYQPETVTLDFTLYHEDIPTQTHSKSFIGIHESTLSGYVERLVTEMTEYVSITNEDHEQLRKSIEDILLR